MDLIKLLISESSTLNLNLQNKNGQTPLHLAVTYKSLDVIILTTKKTKI
jgi:ankyrin repeat protein